MALILNAPLRGAILDGFRTAGAALTYNTSKIHIYLFSEAIKPYPSVAPATASGYNTAAQYSWRTVGTNGNDITTISLGRAGDVMSIAGGTLSNSAVQTSTITWAMVQTVSNANCFFITDSVGLAGSDAIIQLSTLDSVAGQTMSIVSVSLRMLGA